MLTDELRGDDKSRIKRNVLFFLGTTPKGEQCMGLNGGLEKGPKVWPRLIYFDKAELTAVGFARVEAKLRGRVDEC